MARTLVVADHQVVGVGHRHDSRGLARIADFSSDRRFRLVMADLAAGASGLTEGIDVVVHLAAQTFVDHSIRDPGSFVRANVLGTHMLLEDARRHRPRLYVQISTDEVYGPILSGYHDETAPLAPSNPYAASKGSADLLCHSYWVTYQIPTIVIRTANNYGAWQHPQKAIPTFARAALRSEPLPVYGDGLHRRCWLAVEDFVQAILTVMAKGAPGNIYHAASQEEVANIDLALSVLRILGRPDDQIRLMPDHDVRPGHDRRYGLDASKLRSLGWAPQATFARRLEEVVRWYEANRWWLD